MDQLTRIEFDGGSRGNPGPAAGAAVILLPAGDNVEATKFLPCATNNEAEFTGALLGLSRSVELGLDNIELVGDSQLVICQLTGKWKVKKSHLIPLWQEAQALLRKLKHSELSWIPREENKLADAAVNRCIDAGLGIDRSALEDLTALAPTSRQAGVIEELLRKHAQGKVKFQDLLRLKVGGTDEFSRLTLVELRDRIPENIQLAVQSGLGANCTDEAIAKCFRWYLRGLPPALAVRKAAVDQEIALTRFGPRYTTI